ncbi:MAG: M28 family peptidase [Pseudomonadota bacterium]
MLINPGLPRPPVTAGIAAALLVCAALAMAVLRPAAPPAASTADAAASAFSSARANEHMRFLAARPRPIASAANAEARHYIVGQLKAMGLEPQVQTAAAQKTWIDRHRNARVALGVVNNVVLHIPGNAPDHARRPALLMAAAYDTGERSVGASASAAPVSALLETLRVLQAGAPLANDLLVLFADGEQVGGLGTRAFAGRHPLAKRVGVVLRFDGAGSAGAPVLIGASGDNRAAIRGWAGAAPDPHGSSLMQAVYQFMPGAPDMGALATLGRARLHFANVESSNGYAIGSRDSASRLDPATVLATGETMIALARHFGQAPPDAGPPGQAVYFNLPGIGVVHYPADAVWMVTRLACLMFVIVCSMTVYRGDAAPGDIVIGALGFVFIGAMAALAAFLIWTSFPSLHPGYDFRSYGAGARDRWFLGAFATLGTAMFILFQRGLRRAVGHAAAALGPLLLIAILLALASWKLPGASHVLAWPLAGTLLAYGALYSPSANRLRGHQRALILLAGAVPALLLVAPLVPEVFGATSPERMNLPMAMLALLLGLTALLLTAQRRFLVRGLLAASAACLAVAASGAPYGAAPIAQPNRMVYLKDAYNWKSYWMLPAGPLDAWSKRFFPDAVRAQVQVDAFGHGSPKLWLARAPGSPLAYPDIVLLKDELLEKGRTVEFTLQAKPEVPSIDVTLKGAGTLKTSVNGRPLTLENTNNWTLSLYGMGGQLLRFRFDLNSGELSRIFIHERIPGLPQNAVGARPAGMPPPMTPMTETTILSDTLLFR